MYKLREYTECGNSPFHKWVTSLDSQIKARVLCQITRMEHGNLADSKAVGDGVLELRMHFGAGYRVYYGWDGDSLIILLGGGSKRKQSADIATAKRCWTAYKKAR